MPRPTGSCAKCVRETQPGCEHLGNAYDRYQLKRHGALIDAHTQEGQELEQELIEYALNRMLALDRDNGNKAEGKQASRIYKSRNTRVSDLFANKCHVRRGAVQCMRNAGHPADDRDSQGSHKF